MYRWKCLENIAGGRHKCDLTCMIDGDEEDHKTAAEIRRQRTSLSRLVEGLKGSTVEFVVPENGFAKLDTLVENISDLVRETDSKVRSFRLSPKN